MSERRSFPPNEEDDISSREFFDDKETPSKIKNHLLKLDHDRALLENENMELKHDDLTGLLGKNLFVSESLIRIQEVIIRNSKNKDSDPTSSLAIGIIDLDGFKAVNDTFGHQTGDKMLKQTAKIIRSSIRNEDIAARVGGDEFSVLLDLRSGGEKNMSDQAISVVRQRLKDGFDELSKNNPAVKLGYSIGFSIIEPSFDDKPEELLETHYGIADRGMYKEKNGGGSY